MYVLIDGIADNHTGDTLLADNPLYVARETYYVSPTGNDANTGLRREDALATLDRALTLLAATGYEYFGGIIMLCEGYTRTGVATLTIGINDLTIIGEGSASGVPSVSLGATIANPDVAAYIITGKHVEFRNVRFTARGAASNQEHVRCTGHNVLFRNCRFDCGPNDTFKLGINMTVLESGERVISVIEDCTFVSAGTGLAARPSVGLLYGNTDGGGIQNETGAYLSRVTFDGGAYGFSRYAMEMRATSGAVRATDISLLRGADVALGYYGGGGSIGGYFHVAEATGGATVKMGEAA